MSNPEARRIVAEYIADYAENHSNVDYIHVWLADGRNNHCECDKCRKRTPSDWYMMIMNEVDEKLEAKGLDTRIVFCVYSDTAYEPTCEHLNNPERFIFILGAITRSYCYSVPKDPVIEKFTPFVLNESGRPYTTTSFPFLLLRYLTTD